MQFDKQMQRALEADGEKLRQLTDEDHGPYFPATAEPADFDVDAAFAGLGAGTDNLVAENSRLKRELAARAIRTTGPQSPFWNCTICGVAHLTPIRFEHKSHCLLADAPLPEHLWPEDAKDSSALYWAAPVLLAALKAILDTHGKPHREEWLNEAGFEHAKAVDAQARAALARASGKEATRD